MICGLPTAVRVFNALNVKTETPLTVKEGRNFITTHFKNEITFLEKSENAVSKEAVLELKNLWFKYERDLPDILKNENPPLIRKVDENGVLIL